MASIMQTPSHSRFDMAFGGSTMRQPYLSADAPSMLDTLPSVDFGYDGLREQMARFTARFDDFIERGRKRVLEERNHFRLGLAEIQESQRARKRELEDLANKTAAHQDTLAKEAHEQEEMQRTIQDLSARRQHHQSHRDNLKIQMSEIQKAIQIRRHAQLQHQRYLDDQARHNQPELDFWESHLSLSIDGAGHEDMLRFTFTHIDDRDWERECWFEMDMSGKAYSIISTEPRLDHESVDDVLERLNETGELASFLKSMRQLFVGFVRS